MGYKASAADRRAFPRVSTLVPVQVSRPDAVFDQPIAATLQDISQSGALLVVTEPIQDGEWVVIKPDDKGAGFGAEITAIIERELSREPGKVKLTCRFPEPLDYSLMRLFM